MKRILSMVIAFWDILLVRSSQNQKLKALLEKLTAEIESYIFKVKSVHTAKSWTAELPIYWFQTLVKCKHWSIPHHSKIWTKSCYSLHFIKTAFSSIVMRLWYKKKSNWSEQYWILRRVRPEGEIFLSNAHKNFNY